jgi:hypothetical protein
MAMAGTALDELVADAETPTPVGEDEGGPRPWVPGIGDQLSMGMVDIPLGWPVGWSQ